MLELDDVGKSYGNVHALRGVNITVRQGEVTCVLGDNGAGKSTLIKIISGLHDYTEGTMKFNGEVTRFASPRGRSGDRHRHRLPGPRARPADVGVAQLLPRQRDPQRAPSSTSATMKRICGEELTKMGIVIPDLDRPVGGLSGGQRQCVAIARAIYFGARVVILDEPTAALGVKQSGVVLKYIVTARDAGLGVIFITHNPHHAYLVGNHFVILKLGRVVLDAHRDELTLEQLTGEMAGGDELDELSHELRGVDPGKVVVTPRGAVEHGVAVDRAGELDAERRRSPRTDRTGSSASAVRAPTSPRVSPPPSHASVEGLEKESRRADVVAGLAGRGRRGHALIGEQGGAAGMSSRRASWAGPGGADRLVGVRGGGRRRLAAAGSPVDCRVVNAPGPRPGTGVGR